MSNKPKEITAIYDLGDESKYADRYTVLFSKKDFPDVSNSQYVQSLGMSGSPDHPQGVSQWGEALPGSHLGKKIKWDSLPDNVKKHIIKRLSNDNESHVKLRRSCNRAKDLSNLSEDLNFKKGSKIHIRAHSSKKGKGLSYEAMNVTADEDGRSGGWDVYDGTDESGNEISFYGFSVDKKGWSKSENLRRSFNRSRDLTALAEEDASSYFVLADPKEADKIVRSGKDDKALFKGTAEDAAKYAKDKLSGKDAVMLQRDSQGKYKYAVGSDDKKAGSAAITHERKTGGKSMSRAKDITKLVESASVNEMYALGADHIVNWLKKTAYERFDVDPSAISVVPWPQDGSDFNITSPLSKEQYEELSEKITRTYPLYVVEFVDGGVMKFFSSRTVGTDPANTEEIYPRDNMLP